MAEERATNRLLGASYLFEIRKCVCDGNFSASKRNYTIARVQKTSLHVLRS